MIMTLRYQRSHFREINFLSQNHLSLWAWYDQWCRSADKGDRDSGWIGVIFKGGHLNSGKYPIIGPVDQNDGYLVDTRGCADTGFRKGGGGGGGAPGQGSR